jgi:diguanylate cyclase (GGDEF)-like protein
VGLFSSSTRKKVAPKKLGYTEDLVVGDEQAISLSRNALADLVAYFGKESFGIPEQSRDRLRQRCEQLRDFLLSSQPPPHDRTFEDSVVVADLPSYPNSPNLTDTVHFMMRRRKAEAIFVRTTVPALKNAFMNLVHKVQGALVEDSRDDDDVRRALDTLSAALATEDLEELRDHAERAVDTVSRRLEARTRRSEKQLAAMGEQLKSLREELLEAEAKSCIDPLTQLYNRRGLEARFEQELMVSRLTSEALSVGMVDIDFFKSINDRFGHGVGDEALQFVANLLVEVFKEKAAVVSRCGGEEFLVVLPNHTEWAATKRLEVFRERLAERSMPVDDRKLTITASVGVACLTGSETGRELVERADQALYVAKKKGRNQVIRWSKRPPVLGSDAEPAERG